MRVLLDEQLPVDLAAALQGHSLDTVVGRGRNGITNGNFGSDRTYYWTLSRRRRFYSHAKPISVWNRVTEFLKADDPPGRVLHEHDFLAGFLADMLLVAIAEPVRVRPSRS